MNKYTPPLLCCMVVASASSGIAQERAALGNAEAQVTWTGLTNQITTVKETVNLLDEKIIKIGECGAKRMFYAPGAAGGCLAPDVTVVPPATVPPPPPPPPPVTVPPPPPPPPPKTLQAVGGGNCTVTWCETTKSSHCGGPSIAGCPSTWTYWGVGGPGGCNEGTSTYGYNGTSFTCSAYR